VNHNPHWYPGFAQRREDAKKSRWHSFHCVFAPLRDIDTELKGVTDRIVAMIGELSQ